MMKPYTSSLCVILVAAAGAAAQPNLAHNGSFETPDMADPTRPEGWRGFNTARYRMIGDGQGPILVRTGTRSIELASGADFVGYTTDVFNPNTLGFYNPPYVYPGEPLIVTGYYAIPADQALTGANAGIKLEFRRENSSIYQAFETLTINGHTNGEWVPFTITFLSSQINPSFPPFPVAVSILPMRFGPTTATGTIFWDDFTVTQGSTVCYANCDASTTAPVLNVNDFICFQNRYAAGNSYANCDLSTIPPVLNVNDFTCFLNRFAAGDPYANCDGSSVAPMLNVNDFSCFMNRYAVGCP